MVVSESPPPGTHKHALLLFNRRTALINGKRAIRQSYCELLFSNIILNCYCEEYILRGRQIRFIDP